MTKESEAYLKLVDLSVRSRMNATDIPEQINVEPTWSGIGFRLQDEKYVCPISEISEIIHPPKFTTLPGVQPWVRGVANVRGRLIPILDLAGFVFNKISPPTIRKRKVLIIDKEQIYSGIMVDEILGMQHFEMRTYSEETGSGGQEIMPYLSGQYRVEDDVWRIFSPLKLVADPKFMQVTS